MFWKNGVKNWDGKLYKILVNGKSCHGGELEWSLPEDGKPGEWTPVINDVKMCISGYHLTTHYAHWSDKKVEVYEAEGDVIEFDGYDKVVCSRVRLLKRVENPFPDENNNSGYDNSGNCNSGNYNSGDRNSGNWNSGNNNSGNRNSGNYNSGDGNSGSCNSGSRNPGDWNSGNYNPGHYNSGNRNSGNYNSGDRNSGNWNSGNNNSGNRNSGNYNSGDGNSGSCNSGSWNPGDWNSGNYNPGHYNSGNRNSGNRNSGNYNSGDCNSGDKNSGHWNSGNGNYRYLCTQTQPTYLFNKPVPEGWDCRFPSWMHFNLFPEGYKASWQRAFKNAPIEGVKELINLPNFDFEIFEEISSITEEQIRDKLIGS